MPTPGPILLGSVVIPDQTIQVGLFQHAVVKGGTYPVYSTASDLTAADVVSMLTAAGITPDTAAPQKLTPQQWQAIIELILQLLPILFPPTPPTPSMRARAGKLTPQQWAAIIQLVLTLLPIFLGG